MESSAGNIQQRQYVPKFEYEYQNRENAITIINDNTGASDIQREEQGIKLALAQIVAARDYFEAAVGSVQDSDLEVFDFMLRYQKEMHGGKVIDGNHMWILQVPDDSSPHYYLRYQLCTERHAKMLIIWPMKQTLCEAFRNITSLTESTYL